MNKKNNFFYITLIGLLCFFGCLSIPYNAKTADAKTPVNVYKQIEDNMMNTRIEAGYAAGKKGDKTYLEIIVSDIITILLSFVGVIFLILTIWGGYLWMTAGGNEEQVTKAKTIIRNGAIGIAIVLAAYLITYAVTKLLIDVSGV